MGEIPGAQGATIVDQGTYEELVARGRDLSNILDEQTRQVSVETEVRSGSVYGSSVFACSVVSFLLLLL